MRLVVLGSSAATPAPGDACSGYLVSQGQTHLLLDCGSGVLSRLREAIELERLSAVYITHFHPDHYLDLITLRYAIRYGSNPGWRVRLLVPPGAEWFLTQLGLALRNNGEFFSACFRIEEYAPSRPMRVGDLELTVQRTTHDEPTWAVSVQGAGRLVYTGDTQPSVDLEAFAQGADMLLCEATYPTHEGEVLAENHLTGAQAGELARRAGVRELVLTHFWPTYSREEIVGEAEAAFGAPVTGAATGLQLEVGAAVRA
jgi:ribonuclease BN (tRNA processing enzyme)